MTTRRKTWPVRAAGYLVAALGVLGGSAEAQRDTIPRQEYYACYREYFEGNFVEALRRFRDAERGGARGANGRWIDSIPLHTMVGECHYQLGNNGEALASYAAAMQQFLRFPDFLFRVNWDTNDRRPVLTPRGPRITWGPEKRIGKRAIYSASQKYLRGNVQYLPAGIKIDSRSYIHIHVLEIARTLTVAIRRYGELKGPTAKYDPLLKKVIDELVKRPTKPRHWTRAMVEVMLGCAYRAAGRVGDAMGPLTIGRVAGEYEHPLTAVAALELGHIALVDAKFAAAGEWFEKATYAAVQFYRRDSPGWPGACDLLEEAFRYGMIAHRLANHRQPFAMADQASAWARANDMTYLQASLQLDAAESYIGLRRYPEADGYVTTARSLITRRRGTRRPEMTQARIGARLRRVEALVRFKQNNIVEGEKALAAAMEFQGRGSRWMFQIALAEALLAKPPASFSERNARSLLATLLRDPNRYDWEVQPLEAFSVLVGPRGIPMEHWFELTVKSNRAGGEKALEIADLIRRHRFHRSLKFGGRLLSLRWLLESPVGQLGQEAARQRRDVLVAFPDYDKLSRRARQLRTELQEMPLVISRDDDAEAHERQRQKLKELTAVSVLQESLLKRMSLDRIYAPLIFPPKITTKKVQEALPDGHGMLIFLATTPNGNRASRLYGFVLTRDKTKYPTWRVRDPKALMRHGGRMLRAMGHFNERRVVAVTDLLESDWKSLASTVFTDLFTTSTGAKVGLPRNLQELVIVPDSSLWYLPFEALQVPVAGGRTQPLISHTRIRYAPTMSLALPDSRGRSGEGNTAVAVGRMFPGRDEGQRAAGAFQRLRRAVGNAVALPETLPAPTSIYSTLFDRLVVLDDLATSGGPYALKPVATNRGPGGTLGSWLPLPWGGPDQMILPGFHTAAEHGLSEKERNPRGSDVFLSVCAMMGTGTRTMLLSRWRTGGKTSFDLVREFAQELPHTTAAAAWQRSVFLCADSPLSPDLEPRVNAGLRDQPGKADHPFFWSGYLLVDTGARPLRTDPAVAQNAAPGDAR